MKSYGSPSGFGAARQLLLLLCIDPVVLQGDISLIEYLDSHLDAVRQQGTRLILAGDFNFHNTDWLGSTKTTPTGEAMEVLSAAHYLTCLRADQGQ